MTTDADTARQSGDAAWWTEQKIFLVLQRFCMKNAITDPTWVHAHEIWYHNARSFKSVSILNIMCKWQFKKPLEFTHLRLNAHVKKNTSAKINIKRLNTCITKNLLLAGRKWWRRGWGIKPITVALQETAQFGKCCFLKVNAKGSVPSYHMSGERASKHKFKEHLCGFHHTISLRHFPLSDARLSFASTDTFTIQYC